MNTNLSDSTFVRYLNLSCQDYGELVRPWDATREEHQDPDQPYPPDISSEGEADVLSAEPEMQNC